MSKRFIDTEIWMKDWFQSLSPKHKCLWRFLCDNCDSAGVWEANFRLAEFMIGEKITREDMAVFGDRVKEIRADHFWLTGFIKFQYGKLSHDCKPHIRIISALKKHGISVDEYLSTPPVGRSVSKGTKLAVVQRDGMKCTYCEADLNEETAAFDHVIPHSNGGSDEPGNLVVACHPCNNRKSDSSVEEFLEGNPIRERVLKKIYTLSGNSQRVKTTLEEEEKEKEEEKDLELFKEEGGGEKPPAITVDDLVNAWNSFPSLPKVQKISSDRKRHATVRLRDPFFVQNFAEAIRRISVSSFCLGGGPQRWVANFDFLLQPDTVLKVMEGKYDNRNANSQTHKPNPRNDGIAGDSAARRAARIAAIERQQKA